MRVGYAQHMDQRQLLVQKRIVKLIKKLERPVPGCGKSLDGLTVRVGFGDAVDETSPASPAICAVCREDAESDEERLRALVALEEEKALSYPRRSGFTQRRMTALTSTWN